MKLLTWPEDCYSLCRLILHCGRRSAVSQVIIQHVAPFLQPPRHLTAALTIITSHDNFDTCRVVEQGSSRYLDIEFPGESIGYIASKANGLLVDACLSPIESQTFAFSSTGNKLRVVSGRTGRSIDYQAPGEIQFIKFSPDGSRIVVVTDLLGIFIVEAVLGLAARQRAFGCLCVCAWSSWRLHCVWVCACVAVAQESLRLYCVCIGTLCCVCVAFTLRLSLRLHCVCVLSLRLRAAKDLGTLGLRVTRVETLFEGPSAMAFAPMGDRIALWDGGLWFCDLDFHRLDGNHDVGMDLPLAYGMSYSPNGDSIVAFGDDGFATAHMVLYSIARHEVVFFLEWSGYSLRDAVYAPSGAFFFTVGTGGTDRMSRDMCRVDVVTGECSFLQPPICASCATLTPNGTHLTVASDQDILLVDVASTEVLCGWRPVDPAFSIQSVFYAPCSKLHQQSTDFERLLLSSDA